MEKEHNINYGKTAAYVCGVCGSKFTESRSSIRHLKTDLDVRCTQSASIVQEFINFHVYHTTSSCDKHEKDAHGTQTEVPEKDKSKIERQETKHAIEKFFESFRL